MKLPENSIRMRPLPELQVKASECPRIKSSRRNLPVPSEKNSTSFATTIPSGVLTTFVRSHLPTNLGSLLQPVRASPNESKIIPIPNAKILFFTSISFDKKLRAFNKGTCTQWAYILLRLGWCNKLGAPYYVIPFHLVKLTCIA